MSATSEVVDNAKVGKKGVPLHFAAFGIEPPMKTVPVDGGVPQTDAPALSTMEIFEAEIQAMVDATARQKQFRDGVTLASYVASTNAEWAAQAQTFIAWRDQVWAYCYAELAKVQAGERAQPTISEFLAELETQFPLAWPQ